MGFLQDFIQNAIRTGGVFAVAAIVFAETGLLIGFFLPGDSLLVTAGILASRGTLSLPLLLILLPIAAIAGNATGYQIGKRAGAALYSRPDSRLFKRSHLMRAHAFYEKHGGKTIIIARWVPIIRTFAPTVAGAAEMGYRRFARYDVFGGTSWPISMVLAGYFLGGIPFVAKHLELVIVIVVFLSILPALIEAIRHRRREGAPQGAVEPGAR